MVRDRFLIDLTGLHLMVLQLNDLIVQKTFELGCTFDPIARRHGRCLNLAVDEIDDVDGIQFAGIVDVRDRLVVLESEQTLEVTARSVVILAVGIEGEEIHIRLLIRR